MNPVSIQTGIALLLAFSAQAAARRPKAEAVEAKAPATFASVRADHPLAGIWNDPDFTRRLIGSYGFASDAEPRMTPEEHAVYRDKVVPALREDPKQTISLLASLAKPSATAVFDFTLGNVYFQTEDLTNAVKYFEAALAKFPDYKRAQKNLAFALVRSEKYSEAIAPLTRTIALGAGDGRVFGLLAFAYINQNRFMSAYGAYQQALVFDPENADFKLGVVKCAVATANYDHALALLDELVQQNPEQARLWNLQANILIQKEQPTKAAVSLEMLRRLGKAAPPNLFLLGDIYMTLEARDLALPAYLEAVEKDGGQNPGKAIRPAQILVSRGAWDEAAKLFSKIRTVGNLAEADELKLLKLESKMAMATGAGEKAIKTLEQILLKDPLDGEALMLAGDYYAKAGDRETAEYRYQSASGIKGFESEAFVKQAQSMVQTQKYAKALELLHKAQKIKPRENVQRYLEKVEQIARTTRS